VQLPLKLDVVPALTQLMLETGALSRDHVWYQSSEKLLLGALGETTTAERDFVVDMEEQNQELYTGVRGSQGEGGNVSNSLRLNLRSNVAALRLDLSRLARLGVPENAMDVLNPKALTTMPNERFHIVQRLHSPMPSVLEWLRLRALNIRHEAALFAGDGFSNWSGTRRSRTYYLVSRGQHAVHPVYQLKKLSEDEAPSAADLAAGREFVGELRGVRCRWPTDRGKEQVGTNPGVYYEPRAVKPITSKEAEATLSRLLQYAGASLGGSSGTDSGSSSASSSLAQSQPLLFAHSLVYVKPDRQEDGVWIAELCEGLSMIVTKMVSRKAKQTVRVTMSSQRLRINYFRRDDAQPAEAEGIWDVVQRMASSVRWQDRSSVPSQ